MLLVSKCSTAMISKKMIIEKHLSETIDYRYDTRIFPSGNGVGVGQEFRAAGSI